MENLKETLKSIWTKEIEIRFNKGLITYERQLQAELYRLLKKELNDEEKYEVWVEPVLYKIFPWHIIKPDIIITNEKEKLIIGIIEIAGESGRAGSGDAVAGDTLARHGPLSKRSDSMSIVQAGRIVKRRASGELG